MLDFHNPWPEIHNLSIFWLAWVMRSAPQKELCKKINFWKIQLSSCCSARLCVSSCNMVRIGTINASNNGHRCLNVFPIENFIENRWEMLETCHQLWADSLPNVLNRFSTIFYKFLSKFFDREHALTVSDTIYLFTTGMWTISHKKCTIELTQWQQPPTITGDFPIFFFWETNARPQILLTQVLAAYNKYLQFIWRGPGIVHLKGPISCTWLVVYHNL